MIEKQAICFKKLFHNFATPIKLKRITAGFLIARLCLFLICLVLITQDSFCNSTNIQKLGYKISSIISPNYTLIKPLGSGGESEVFLIKDRKGKLYALKYWLEEKQHDYLRGITAFQNSIEAHKRLSCASYINTLYEVIEPNILILGYLKGEELRNYLQKNLTISQVKSIANQIIYALTNMSKQGVIGLDTSAENIIVTLSKNDPSVTLIDLSAYISVDNLCQRNKDFHPQKFSIYHSEKVRKLLIKHKNYTNNYGHILIDGVAYHNLPSITLYAILADRMSLLSSLLTKQYYIQKGCSILFPKHLVKERFHKSFGDDPNYIIRPITPAILKKALGLIQKARVTTHGSKKHILPPYTEKDFRADWRKMEEIFSLIVHRTHQCQIDLKKCLVRNTLNI